jgi:hypothetical protein
MELPEYLKGKKIEEVKPIEVKPEKPADKDKK